MIKFAKKDDKEQLIKLWQESFEDSRRYIERFLNSYKIEDCALACFNENELVSMMFLLPCDLVVMGKSYSSLYIYALCTAKEYRNKGYASALIEFSKNLASENNIDFLILSPSSDELYDYYARLGFKKAFKEKSVPIERKFLNLLANNDEDVKETFRKSFYDIRNDFLKDWDYVKWSEFAIGYAVEESDNCISADYGYVLYHEDSEKCTVSELCVQNGCFGKAIRQLLDKSSCNLFEFILPVLYPLTKQDELQKDSGMLFAVTEMAKEISDTVKTAYLGLKLN